MKAKDNPIFSISIKLALVILIIAIIMLFFVKFNTAEFYVTIFTIILMSIFIVIAAIIIRKGEKHDKE